MKHWDIKDDHLTLYDYTDQQLPLVRITSIWAKPGIQSFNVRHYPDGFRETESDRWERFDNLTTAIRTAEEWLT